MIGYLLVLFVVGLGASCWSPSVRAFWERIHSENPLLLRYEDEDEEEDPGAFMCGKGAIERSGDERSGAHGHNGGDLSPQSSPEEEFETRYMARFHAAPEEYYLGPDAEAELVALQPELRAAHFKEREATLADLQRRLDELQPACDLCADTGDDPEQWPPEAVRALVQYGDQEEEYEYDPEMVNLEHLRETLRKERDQVAMALDAAQQAPPPDFAKQARDVLVARRLEQLRRCYTEEATPRGSVVMHYDSAKESFAYFSDRSIPFRMLEVVARKYVSDYQCKPLFVVQNGGASAQNSEPKSDPKSEPKSAQKSEPKTTQKSARVSQPGPPPRSAGPSVPPVPAHRRPAAAAPKDKVANHYTWAGKLCDFSQSQQPPPLAAAALSYAEFKQQRRAKG
jgi:hypothetical protein